MIGECLKTVWSAVLFDAHTLSIAERQFDDLISRGFTKVNISTALKVPYFDAYREFLQQDPANSDPPALVAYVRAACKELAKTQIEGFHSAGKAA